jgi:hypothetical protein
MGKVSVSSDPLTAEIAERFAAGCWVRLNTNKAEVAV